MGTGYISYPDSGKKRQGVSQVRSFGEKFRVITENAR